jgi:hypothetical protein
MQFVPLLFDNGANQARAVGRHQYIGLNFGQ